MEAAMQLDTARPRILLVEDSKTNRDIIKTILSEKYQVLLAEDGKQGVVLAKKELPDLILMDAEMPVMNGYDACALLKADPQTINIPVIFITSRNASEDELRGLTVGAIDYITKPISPPVVELRVRNHLDLKFYRDKLESMATMDGLTSIANRRRFNEFIAQEWARGKREKNPLSICLIDIDHFKLYNDHYGHIKGDESLKNVAQALNKAANRPADLIARYGGEEFACVLPNTDHQGAINVANKLLESVRKLVIPHEKSLTTDSVSVSIGVATYIPDDIQTPQHLIELSDQQLYNAKENGRNQVMASAL